ncbi:MAG: DUF1302 family protein, partial [Nitrospirota bacterium]
MGRKKVFCMAFGLMVVLALLCSAANAERLELFGKPLDVYGLISQNASFGWHQEFDTEAGLNSSIWTVLLEGAYQPTSRLKAFGQFILVGDWVYALKNSDDSWVRKEFDKSDSALELDDHYWQIVKELHLTWSSGNFLFRIGKQIISWGETDAIRVMDQINPLDERRGIADVEFESTIIPIWLVRADYSPPIESAWLQDLNIQFWFNPNADFIPGQPLLPGNDVAGIWGPYMRLDPTDPSLLLGSLDLRTEEPDAWSSEGHEYGLRLQGLIKDALVSLNGFYGRENNFVLEPLPVDPGISFADRFILVHPTAMATYPYLRFVGGTFSKDLQFVGNLVKYTPVLRVETLYAFDSTFSTVPGTLVKKDELRWAVGLDWKTDIYFLNPSHGISFSGQFFHRKIFDFPDEAPLDSFEDDNYTAT